ncbi:hypothetical protein [Knoellia koreensis]|uniref:Mycothiol-dependent maleylpyruvate isomerase metal-binding domain-containing protein n=1 Tax=Knoellia koreensis TaxID=2730921 RepID=A0A849HE90_9MICO|nr:hypothetical protein [Knoellia sp. DB2414S]NNM45439.1 hypothetical protein [Knoellia sp. DB2414S]
MSSPDPAATPESLPISTPEDLRRVVDAVMAGFAQVPDNAWDHAAYRLDWDCRDTAAHLMDDFAFYALNLASRVQHTDTYAPFLEPPPWRPGSPPQNFWPDPDLGTAGIVRGVDATGGLLVAVTATAPRGHLGFHPRGNGDASGFAAMGIVEAAAHAWDVLMAQGIEFRIDDDICERVLARLFPWSRATDDPWQEFLRVTGRTEETRDQPWTWDSSVRDTYSVGALRPS